MNERKYETPITKTATVVVEATTGPRGIMSLVEATYILTHMKPPVPTGALVVRHKAEEEQTERRMIVDPYKQWTEACEIINLLVDACDRLMGDSDLPVDESFEYRAIQRAGFFLRQLEC